MVDLADLADAAKRATATVAARLRLRAATPVLRPVTAKVARPLPTVLAVVKAVAANRVDPVPIAQPWKPATRPSSPASTQRLT